MKKSLILTPVVMCFLSACNGGSGNDSSSNSVEGSSPETVNIENSPIQSKGLVSEEVAIDVLATNDVNAAMEVTSVRSISGDSCQVTSIDKQSFTTSSDEVGECQYEYTVAPQNSELYVGEESSIARVSVSETAADNTVPNLAETTDIDTPVVIDLSQELAEELDTSVFYLSSDASVLGAGIVDSDAANNMLTFTPFDVGVSRITYSMTDGSVTKLGTIDVAVSDTQNTPPVALNYVREGKLDKDMLVTIDLTEYVSDAEDSVILESVRAYNAVTEITSASEHTFTFRSSEPGAHEVAYTINDGRGGYDVGQVYIEVEPDFSLVQDWEDITLTDAVIEAEITFSAPMSEAMAEYVNADYIDSNIESGEVGPRGVQIAYMNWEQAKNYCYTRGGRLPMTRELESLLAELPFFNHNWPTEIPYWSVDRLSEADAQKVDLTSSEISSGNANEDYGYVTCVYLNGDAKDFTVTNLESDDFGDSTNTTRKITTTLLDPDGNPAPYQDVMFWIRSDGVGGFGASNTDRETEDKSDINGISTAFYEFTRGYEDNVMVQYRDSVDFVTVNFAEGGFDVTNPNDWNVSKVNGTTELEAYEPIISDKGTKVAVGEISQFITSIAKKPLLGEHVEIKFGLDRSTTDKLTAGNTNIVLQQVSSKAPNIYESCDEAMYGDCRWSTDNKDDAGIPQTDERWLAFIFDYYGSKIVLKDKNGILAQGTLTNRGLSQLYYKVVINGSMISIYQATNTDYSDQSLALSASMESSSIDTESFYYFGLSGGAHGNSGVRAVINALDIQY
ncbi:hypothetical protein GCM10007906_14630 [Vibrio hyugaensis]|uniref:Uncharacterized protein n=1 Tax=Vibrio hyugaensis TaxID=1534743 RepID=A0ABQ5XYW7_9VIBR|nr:hypothetical protein [Vibrio hyugaensis]GLR03876.1 hypothetical protein GCM10007906_14630 [Vibrio hyugaensis]